MRNLARMFFQLLVPSPHVRKFYSASPNASMRIFFFFFFFFLS